MLTSRLARPRIAGKAGWYPRLDAPPGRAVGVADHRVGDVPHEGTFHPAEPAAADHYHAGIDVLGKVYYRLIPSSSIFRWATATVPPASSIFRTCSSSISWASS